MAPELEYSFFGLPAWTAANTRAARTALEGLIEPFFLAEQRLRELMRRGRSPPQAPCRTRPWGKVRRAGQAR
jgi:hypothetical protein